jgi:hypothetical protein
VAAIEVERAECVGGGERFQRGAAKTGAPCKIGDRAITLGTHVADRVSVLLRQPLDLPEAEPERDAFIGGIAPPVTPLTLPLRGPLPLSQGERERGAIANDPLPRRERVRAQGERECGAIADDPLPRRERVRAQGERERGAIADDPLPRWERVRAQASG